MQKHIFLFPEISTLTPLVSWSQFISINLMSINKFQMRCGDSSLMYWFTGVVYVCGISHVHPRQTVAIWIASTSHRRLWSTTWEMAYTLITSLDFKNYCANCSLQHFNRFCNYFLLLSIRAECCQVWRCRSWLQRWAITRRIRFWWKRRSRLCT